MRLADQRGMTLVELMVAIAIFSILMAIAIPNFIQRMDRAREGAVKANMSTLQLVAEDYAVQNQGVYSASLDATHMANALPSAFSNPYSGAHGSGAAWEDRLYLYEAPSATPGIVSYADSVTATYNIKGQARQGALHLVLNSGH
jgi:prepilin-type N-terminal cleavage/methylation domain-containing protein